MPADDLSGISGLDDRHRAVLAQKLGITTYYELIMADRQRIAERLSVCRPPGKPPLNVCVQVNISGETTKSGVPPEDTLALAYTAREVGSPQTIVEQVWITTSGIFSQPPFLAALQTFGIDRIMFSVDYPYSANAKGRAFLDQIAFAPVDMAKFTHGNADALLRLKAGAS